MALDKTLKCLENPFQGCPLAQKRLAKSHANCDGLRLGGLRHVAEDVGKAVLARRLA